MFNCSANDFVINSLVASTIVLQNRPYIFHNLKTLMFECVVARFVT